MINELYVLVEFISKKALANEKMFQAFRDGDLDSKNKLYKYFYLIFMSIVYLCYYILQSFTIVYHCAFLAVKIILYMIIKPFNKEANYLISGFCDIIYTKNPLVSFILLCSILYYFILYFSISAFYVKILFLGVCLSCYMLHHKCYEHKTLFTMSIILFIMYIGFLLMIYAAGIGLPSIANFGSNTDDISLADNLYMETRIFGLFSTAIWVFASVVIWLFFYFPKTNTNLKFYLFNSLSILLSISLIVAVTSNSFSSYGIIVYSALLTAPRLAGGWSMLFSFNGGDEWFKRWLFHFIASILFFHYIGLDNFSLFYVEITEGDISLFISISISLFLLFLIATIFLVKTSIFNYIIDYTTRFIKFLSTFFTRV